MKHALIFALVLAVGCHKAPSEQTKVSAKSAKPECVDGQKANHNFTYTYYGGVSTFSESENFPAVCEKGKWIKDPVEVKKQKEEAAQEKRKADEIQQHRLNLWNALRTRVVTDTEMKEILELGADIIPYGEGGGKLDPCGGMFSCSYNSSDFNERESARERNAEIIFNNALLNQFKMRTFAEEKK